MSGGAYMTSGYARQRGLDSCNLHPTDQPPIVPLPIMRGKVIEARQSENTVDVCLTDGTRLTHVPFASPFAGTTYGSYRTPHIVNVSADRDAQGSLDSFTGTGVQDHYVFVAFVGGGDQSSNQRPVVLASIQPQITQQTNSAISWSDRSPNDAFVHLVTDDGHSVEYAPDFTGTVRGPDPTRWYAQAHDPGMAGTPDVDGLWQVINTGDTRSFFAAHCQGSDATIFMHPDGATTMMRNDGHGNLIAAVTITASGDLVSTTRGNHTATAAAITLNAATVHVNGDLHVTGQVVAADMQAQSGSVPGPYGAGTEATPRAGSVGVHDLTLVSPPNNPHTGARP